VEAGGRAEPRLAKSTNSYGGSERLRDYRVVRIKIDGSSGLRLERHDR